MSQTNFSVKVERIEGIWAVLETSAADNFKFPVDLLPSDSVEGSFLNFSILIDAESGDKARADVRSLHQRLLDQTGQG